MYCGKCGQELNKGSEYCPFCGAEEINDTDFRAAESASQKKSDDVKSTAERKNFNYSIIIIILFVLCVAIGLFFGIKGKVLVTDDTSVKTTAHTEESTAAKNEAVTTTENITVAEEITSANPATAVDAGTLYRPSPDKFCNQYKRYISGFFEGQGYAKMRFGPSKKLYNVVGQIDNGNIVTVQTESVDGWTLIYYEETQKEGWVRTDFLFENYEDCFPTEDVLPDVSFSGYLGYVDVTGQYDGEPLNMRSGPSKDYRLITTVPDGAEILFAGISHQVPEWTYIEYNGKSGWVLTKYLIEK